MVDVLFRCILNMSITASLTIAVVIGARALLRKSRRVWSVFLWVPVLFRLLCSFSWKSPVSAVAFTPAETMTLPSGSGNTSMVNYVDLPESAVSSQGISFFRIVSIIWIVGVVLLLCYSILSEVKLVSRLPPADQENIVEDLTISSPFLHGILKPVIYIPSGLTEEEKGTILLHERCHIRNLDPLFKLLFWLAVILHWFNPMVWIAFRLMSEDLESRCDEYVLSHSTVTPPAYAELLLRFAAGNETSAGQGRTSFSMEDSKNRIIHVLKYEHRSEKWIAVSAALIVVLCTAACASNPAASVPAGTADMSAYREIGARRNQFNEVDINGLLEFFENQETGLIYIGRPDLEYCQGTVPVLNQVAADQGLTVLYLDDKKLIDLAPDDSYFMQNWYQLCNDLGPAGDPRGLISMPVAAWVENGELVRYESVAPDSYGKKLTALEKQTVYDSYRNLIPAS